MTGTIEASIIKAAGMGTIAGMATVTTKAMVIRITAGIRAEAKDMLQ